MDGVTPLSERGGYPTSGAGGSALSREPAIDAEVDLIQTGAEYLIRARLNVSLPDLPLDTAQALLDALTRHAPTRGNIDVAIRLI